MIATATDNGVTDFAALLKDYVEGEKKVSEAEAKMKALQDKLKKTTAIPTTGKDTVNADELTYELVMRPANEMFYTVDDSGKPKRSKNLSFEIPTLVWKDSTGKVVDHPEVPEIDENYQLSPVTLLKVLTAFTKGLNSWLYGHTGTGKSTFVEQVAARVGFPVSRVNLDSNLERSDLVGHVVLQEKNGATISRFEEGILPRAMKRPGILLLDEIDAGRPDILFVIQRALEGNGLMLTEDGGRIQEAHPLFRFFATANTRGQGDEYGIYQGTRTLNTAMIDRFPVFVEFKYMKKETEMKLLSANHPDLPDDMCDQMVTLANEIRMAFANGELFQPITPRGLNMLATAYLHFEETGIKKAGETLRLALEMTIYDKTTNDTVQKVRELADRCFRTPATAASKAA